MQNEDDDNNTANASNANANDGNMEVVRKNKRNMEEEERSSRQTDLEDIMSLITSKMDALSTSSEDVSKDEIIAIFMTVLECPDGEAVFYLESTNWNVEMAVQLKLEADESSYYSKRGRTFGNQIFKDPVFQDGSGLQKYVAREVNIEGLPEGWKAVVSRRTGTIYFVNEAFNIRQSQVPPGFADFFSPLLPPLSDQSNENGNGNVAMEEEQIKINNETDHFEDI